MAATHQPVPKAVYLCDRVTYYSTNQKFELHGVFNAVRLPTGATFPHTVSRMCVFVQLEDGSGDADQYVQVVSAATGQAVFRSASHRLRFPTRLTMVTVNIQLANGRFPAAGEYWVELYCDGAIVGDRVLHVLP